ncbi:unnamed protein product [Protopolystoma xenopodis]|uniref:Uncharacterized protein n=1 Tax=Protopolystoma xenopodis TaxID=117903 RepID=A0A3S5FCC9_9PLAT|nr:unnamed protein product [Protopolystoma xenopodis]
MILWHACKRRFCAGECLIAARVGVFGRFDAKMIQRPCPHDMFAASLACRRDSSSGHFSSVLDAELPVPTARA